MQLRSGAMREGTAVLIAGGLILLIAGHYGPLSSLFGQIYYFQGASNLVHGNGMTSCSERFITWIPPGYTLILALTQLFGMSFTAAGVAVSAVSAGVYAWGSMRLLANSISSRSLVWLGFLAMNVNPIVLKWHLEMTSDAVHASAIMLTFGVLSSYLKTGRRTYFRIAVAAIGLAALTRYIGAAAVAAVSCWLLLFSPMGGPRQRFQDALKFGVFASTPLAGFLIYVKSLGLPPGGGRSVISLPISEQLHEVFSELSRWGVNLLGTGVRDATTEEFRIAVFAALVLAGIAGTFVVTFKSLNRLSLGIVWMPAFYAFVYFVMMVTLQTLLPLDDFTGRYVLPLIGPAVFSFVVFLDRCVVLSGGRRAVHALATGVLVTMMIVPANAAWSLASGARSFGVHQMMAPAVVDSDFLREAKSLLEAGTGIAGDQEAAQLLLAHFGRCVPYLKPGENPEDAASGFTHLIEIDAKGIELGSLGIAPPRIRFSELPGTYRPDAEDRKPVGRITPLAK